MDYLQFTIYNFGNQLFQFFYADLLLFDKIAVDTFKLHHAVGFFGGFLFYCSGAKAVNLHIQPNAAAIAALSPVLGVIVPDLRGLSETVSALGAVMLLPFGTLGTDRVRTAKLLCRFGAAIRAKLTIGTDLGAVFALLALLTESGTVGTILAAVLTERFRAVFAVMTVLAHLIRAVDADAAVGTNLIDTARAFAALLTRAF